MIFSVWECKGVNSRGTGRMEELTLHPTVKPVQMIADAIKNVSGRGDIVLDIFGGSGSTLIAAHKTGRRGYMIELDERYCDIILQRWGVFAKDEAEQVICGIPLGHPSQAWRASETHLHEVAECADLVNINTGNGDESIPIARAVIRALGVKAAKGHVYAQRLFAQTLIDIEAERKAEGGMYMDQMIQYKKHGARSWNAVPV